MQQAFIFKQMTFSVLDADLILILIFCQNYAVKVAADKVTKDDADIDAEDLEGMRLEEGRRHCAIIEGVGHTVGEAAYDEERNCEKERKHVSFTGECNCCGHEEAAWDAQEAASEGSGLKPELEYLLRGSLYVHRRDAREKPETETAYDVSKKDEEKLSDFILIDETCCSCVELELVSDYGHKSERE